MGDGALANVTVDPAFGPTERSVSEMNEMMRLLLTEYITAEFADRPDLLEHVVPQYPPGSKRGIRDNGIWARTLKRPNVRLVTDRIGAITEQGIRMADGSEHEFDVIIYGTGFKASEFLTPMRVFGRGGIELHEQWKGEARAYLGVSVPDFPNLFCLYGPNTHIVNNGSIVYFSECGVRFILGLIETALRSGKRAIAVKRDVHDRFNEQVDVANSGMAWGFSTVSSWYKNDSGRVAQNWPFTLLEYWQRTLRPDPAEFDLLG
jgi:4-hydroxyacetophenone monooxygenase